MRHDQGTGPNSPYWSTAAEGGQDWLAPLRDYIRDALQDLPSWVPLAAAGLVFVGLMAAGIQSFSTSAKKRAALDEKHADAVAVAKEKGLPLPPAPLHMNTKPLIGGFAVSLSGLWGFAQEQLGLNPLLALGFISMFDILELYVFSELYRLANEDPRRRWTRTLKWLRFSAWLIVIIAAVANAVHAPSLEAAPFMAAMPVLAAWLLYVRLHSALGAPEDEDERPEGAKPGPLLLAGLVWRKMWASLFGLFGLDVADRADEMVRRARAREAADASYALRKALHRRDQLADEVVDPSLSRAAKKAKEKELKGLERELEVKIRPKAQTALEMADTQDSKQGLQLMQRMAWLTRADDVALLDYGPESPAMRVLEELNIAANADFIESSQRAREEDQRAAAATERAEKAVKALADAEARLAEMTGKLEELGKAEERETNRLRVVTEERERLEQSGSSAQQLYQRTVSELEDARGQVADLEGERRRLTGTLSAIQSQLASLEGDYKGLQAEVNALVEERDRLAGEKALADERAQSASEEAVRLQGRLELFEEMAAEETAGRLAGAVPAARGTGGTSVQARIDTEAGSAGARIAGFQLLEQQYLALPVEERVAMSASALARQWWEDAGLTEQTTRKYIGDIKKMHDKTQEAADGSADGQD